MDCGLAHRIRRGCGAAYEPVGTLPRGVAMALEDAPALVVWAAEQEDESDSPTVDLVEHELARQHARTGGADRARGWVDARVMVHCADQTTITGQCVDVGDASLLIRDDIGEILVTLHGCVSVTAGSHGGVVPPRGRQRLTTPFVLRDWAGESVCIGCSDGRSRSGVLREVGADHLTVETDSAVVLLMWPAVVWVRVSPTQELF